MLWPYFLFVIIVAEFQKFSTCLKQTFPSTHSLKSLLITWTLNKTFAHFRNLNAEKLKYQTFTCLFPHISESSEPTWYAANGNPSLGRTWDTSPPPRENASRKAGDERTKSVHDAGAAAEKSFHEPVKTEEVTKVEGENLAKVRDGNTEGTSREINSNFETRDKLRWRKLFEGILIEKYWIFMSAQLMNVSRRGNKSKAKN